MGQNVSTSKKINKHSIKQNYKKDLDSNKIYHITINTNINLNKLTKIEQKEIIEYIKNVVEDTGAADYSYISNYLFTKKINPKILNNYLLIDIILYFNKKGKNIKQHINNKLTQKEINKICNEENIMNHIIWALNDAATRFPALNVDNKKISFPKREIKSVEFKIA